MNMIVKEALTTDDTLREMAKDVVRAHYPSQAAAGRDAGIGEATFSAWLNGTYKGDNAKVADQVRRWMKAREERASLAAVLPTAPGFVATPTAQEVWIRLQLTQTMAGLCVIVGGPGIGKTVTLEKYAHDVPNVHLVTMDPSTSGVGTCLREIVDELRLPEKSGSGLVRAIGEFLRNKGALLMIDEAQHLSVAALETLRSVRDKYKVGLVLAGNETVYARMEGDRSKHNLAQMFSRVGMKMPVVRHKPQTGDVDALLAAWGIEGAAEVRFCRAIAAKPGALRGMTMTLLMATMLANGEGGPRALRHIEMAWQQLGNQPVEG